MAKAASTNRSGAVIDTNILVCLVINNVNPQRLELFAPTKQGFLTADSVGLIEQRLRKFNQFAVTPAILSETSNILNKGLADPERSQCLCLLRDWLTPTPDEPTISEQFTPALTLMNEASYLRLGLSDTSLVDLAVAGWSVVTVDAGLKSRVYEVGGEVVDVTQIIRSTF